MLQRLSEVFDWLAPLIIATISLVFGYFGLRAGAHPPSEKQQKTYEKAFYILGAIVLVFTAYQIYRSQSDQRTLSSKVDDIKTGVSGLSTQLKEIGPSANGFLQVTHFNAPYDEPQLVPGKRFMMNLAFGNRGTAPVHNANQFSALLLVNGANGNWVAVSRTAKNWFTNQLSKQTWSTGSEVGVDIALWQTVSTGVLSREELQNIQTGRSALCLLGYARWRDTTGASRDVQSCMILVSPPTLPMKRDNLAWRDCY
jgi:hypothetical protein